MSHQPKSTLKSIRTLRLNRKIRQPSEKDGRRLTDQKSDSSELTYMNARYYDPSIGTFISADTIVPDAGNVFDYNRFMYVRGRGLRQSPPSESLQRSFSGDISLLAKGLRQTIDYIMYCHYI